MKYTDPAYHRQKSKEHYAKYKMKYDERNAKQRERTINIFREAKKNGCILCPEREFCALDFHHLDPNEKDFLLGEMRGKNDSLVWKEIEKCVVLCSNCHRKHHAGLPGYSTEILLRKAGKAQVAGLEPAMGFRQLINSQFPATNSGTPE